MYHSELTSSWNLDEFYTGFDDINFHQDFLLLQNSSEKFIKNYKHTFRTFHTSKKLLWFYEENERVLRLAEKIKYFIFYKNFLGISSEDQEYLKKLNTLMSDFFQKFEKIFDECDEIFYNNLEILIKKPEFEKYRFAIFRWITQKRHRKNSFVSKTFFQNALQIQAKIQEYVNIQNRFDGAELDKNSFAESALNIYFSLTQLRVQNVKILWYQNCFEQQCDEYMISPGFFNQIVRQSDNISLWEEKNHFRMNDTEFFLNDTFDIIYKALRWYHPSLWRFLENLLCSWKIFIDQSKKQQSQAFTTGALWFSAYVYVPFSWKIDNIFTLIHELGHAYQLQESQHHSAFHFSASPFLWEFCAVFFEKILEKYLKNQKYKKYDFSYSEKNNKELLHSMDICNIEKRIYQDIENWKIQTADDCRHCISENFSSLCDFLGYQHIVHSPFYTATYIFAHTLVPQFFEKYTFSEFEKIASKWGSESIDSIFAQYF